MADENKSGCEPGELLSNCDLPCISPKPVDWNFTRKRNVPGRPYSYSPQYKSREEQHHARLGEYAACLWKQNSMTDILVVVQGQEFPAHKAVLACYSPYFNEVLLKPGVNNVHNLNITSVTSTAFQILLAYIYTGDLKLTCQDLSDVYRAARRLGMKDALKGCVSLLSVSPTKLCNAIYLYVAAKKLDLLDASVRAFKVMAKHFEQLVATDEFLDLDVEQVMDFLSADEIGARSEVIVYLAALRWLNHDYLLREGYSPRVMSCVRFSLMTLREILACFHPPFLPAIVEHPSIKETMLHAVCYIAAKSIAQEFLFSDLSSKPRKYLLAGERFELWDTALYDPSQYPHYRRQQAATIIQAAFKGYLVRRWYLEEHRRLTKAATTIQAFFRGYKTRKSIRRKGSKAGENGRRKFQGYQRNGSVPQGPPRYKDKVMKITERKETLENKKSPTNNQLQSAKEQKWNKAPVFKPPNYITLRNQSSEPTMLSNSSHLSVNLLSRDSVSLTSAKVPEYAGTTSEESDLCKEDEEFVIYAIGGFDADKGETGNPILHYSPEIDRWTKIGMLSEPKHDIKIVVLNSSIYCIGGCKTSKISKAVPQNLCFRYDLRNRQWHSVHPLNNARMFHGVAVVNGIIYVVGGKNENESILSSVEKYDQYEDEWEEVNPPLPFPRTAMGVASHRGMLWVAGGMTVREGEVTVVDSVHCFDPNENRWMEKLSLPKPIAFVTIVPCCGTLYCLGGTTRKGQQLDLVSISDVYNYDEGSDCWNLSVPLPIPCHSVVAATIDSKIYVLGGFTTHSMSFVSDVFSFDISEGIWQPCCRLPTSSGGYIVSAFSTAKELDDVL